MCQNLHAPSSHKADDRLERVRFEVSRHVEMMMKCPSQWNTSAAPFSHALCLFKVTSEKGICIGKRNSECKEPRCLDAGGPGGQDEEKLVSRVQSTCAAEAITQKFFHRLT